MRDDTRACRRQRSPSSGAATVWRQGVLEGMVTVTKALASDPSRADPGDPGKAARIPGDGPWSAEGEARAERDRCQALAANLDAAFEGLVDAYQDRLYRFALRLTGSAPDAEEIAQDAFARAYRWLRDHPPEGEEFRLKAWLYQVTLNVFRNWQRRRARSTASLDTGLEALPPLIQPGGEPELAAERQETRAELALLLAALPSRYRAAVVLRYVEELSYGEMAAVLERPPNTVKSDVRRGLALLRGAQRREPRLAHTEPPEPAKPGSPAPVVARLNIKEDR